MWVQVRGDMCWRSMWLSSKAHTMHHTLQMYRTVCSNPHSVDKSLDIEDDDDDEEAGEIDWHSSLVEQAWRNTDLFIFSIVSIYFILNAFVTFTSVRYNMYCAISSKICPYIHCTQYQCNKVSCSVVKCTWPWPFDVTLTFNCIINAKKWFTRYFIHENEVLYVTLSQIITKIWINNSSWQPFWILLNYAKCSTYHKLRQVDS